MMLTVSARLAARAGVRWGLAIGGLMGAEFVLALAGVNAGALQETGGILLLASFLAFFALGLHIRQRAASVAEGIRAGLEAALAASIVACALALFVAIVTPAGYISVAAQMGSATAGVGAALVVGLLSSLTQAATGFGLAAAGALAGRPRRAEPGR